MALELELIELIIVEAAKFWFQAPKGTNQPELCTDDVNDQTKSGILSELEADLSFTFPLYERFPRREKLGVELIAAVRGKGEIADLVRGLERAAYQISARQDMLRPWRDKTGERHVCPSL